MGKLNLAEKLGVILIALQLVEIVEIFIRHFVK
jgi:hypothetical protein